ncbi:hypothetical protein MHBO_000128 [Bonamia ostreae]|uniref:Uncharacterized protein n=1 Tax=Bonamia ostreae TaxID=126728 RepID=A0ABV2AEG5_9EUKA
MTYGYPYPQQMQPMAYQPMPYPNSFYPPPQMQAPAPARQYNRKLDYDFVKDGHKRAIVLKNVELPHAVDVKSKTLSFKRGEPNYKGQMPFSFSPDGEDHVVHITSNNKIKHTVNLSPQPPKIKLFKNGGKKLCVENLYAPENLRLKSNNPMKWNLESHPSKKHTYTLNFDPYDNVHDIEIYYVNKNGKELPCKNGKLKLAPKNKPVVNRNRAPMPYSTQYANGNFAPMAYPQQYPMAYPMAYPQQPMYPQQMPYPQMQAPNRQSQKVRRGF